MWCHHGLQAGQRNAAIIARQQGTLRLPVGVAEGDAHQKAVQLAFGQRIGAKLLGGVLRGHHEEGAGQLARGVVHRDLALLHGFQQGALRARAGAVDLVGQQHLREHRAGVEDEGLAAALEHAHAHEVAGHEVGRELHAGEAQAERYRQRLRQRGLAHPGHILDQQVPASHQAGHAVLDPVTLAHDDGVDLVDQAGKALYWGNVHRQHVN